VESSGAASSGRSRAGTSLAPCRPSRCGIPIGTADVGGRGRDFAAVTRPTIALTADEDTSSRDAIGCPERPGATVAATDAVEVSARDARRVGPVRSWAHRRSRPGASASDLQTDDGTRVVDAGGATPTPRFARSTSSRSARTPTARAGEVPNKRTYDVMPHAQAPDFDDSGWRSWHPTRRCSAGKRPGLVQLVCTAVTVPERLGDFDPTGSTVVFEVVVDDYAEVWVDGQLPLVLASPVARWSGVSTRRTAWCSLVTPAGAAVRGSPCSHQRADLRYRPKTTSGCAPRRSTLRAGARVLRRTGGVNVERDSASLRRIVHGGHRAERVAGGFDLSRVVRCWSARGRPAVQLADTTERDSPASTRTSEGHGVPVQERYTGVENRPLRAARVERGSTFSPDGLLRCAQHGNRRWPG